MRGSGETDGVGRRRNLLAPGQTSGEPDQAASGRDRAGPAERGDERVAGLGGAGEPGDVVVDRR